MKCQTCGRIQHYCSSCDMDIYMSEEYCDKICFEKSEKYKEDYKKVVDFLSSLNDVQKKQFDDLWNDGVLSYDLYESMIDSIVFGGSK